MRRTNGMRLDGCLWIRRIEGLVDGSAVKCVIRTDKKCFGGHHPIVVLSQMAVETLAFVIAQQCAKQANFNAALLTNLTLENIQKMLANQVPIDVSFDGWSWSIPDPIPGQTHYFVADKLVFRTEAEVRKAAIQWIPMIARALEANRRIPAQADIKTVRAGQSRPPKPLYVIEIPELDYDSFMN